MFGSLLTILICSSTTQQSARYVGYVRGNTPACFNATNDQTRFPCLHSARGGALKVKYLEPPCM